ncbi:MAG: hypothetical protein R6V10_02180 [bacterium]
MTYMDYGFSETIADKRFEKDIQGRKLCMERLLTASELAPYLELLNRIWGFSEKEEIPLHEAVVVVKTGGLVVGIEVDGARAGLVYAMPAFTKEWGYHHHSNFMGFLPEYRFRGLGLEAKRVHALLAGREGVELITWTFDPLQAANANLNFRKLGAVSRHYLPDLYGRMGGSFDPGLPTDRLLLEWRLSARRVQERLAGKVPSPEELEACYAGATILSIEEGSKEPGDAGPVLVRIPEGVPELAEREPEKAESILLCLRKIISGLFEDGYAITGLIPGSGAPGPNYYVLEKGELK